MAKAQLESGYLEGGVYDSGGVPGGSSSGSPGSVASDPSLITASGGLTGFESMLLIPMYDPEFKTYFVATFDYEDFNTENDCEYYYRQENPFPGRQITCSGARITYRNLGVCTVEVGVSTTQAIKSETRIIGTKAADKKLYTEAFSFVVTGERPQLYVKRKADKGPLSIIEAYMITNVEIAEYLGKGSGK